MATEHVVSNDHISLYKVTSIREHIGEQLQLVFDFIAITINNKS